MIAQIAEGQLRESCLDFFETIADERVEIETINEDLDDAIMKVEVIDFC